MELVWTQAMAGQRARESPSEEARLVAAARKGDRDAFAELVRRHERRVFRLAAKFFRGGAEVEDAAQDTFLTAWRKLGTYRGDAPFEHWLTRLCLNCCYARLRGHRDEEPLEGEIAAAGPDPTARVEAERLLARLQPRDRFLLVLLHGEERSVAEIAELLGWSRANVKVRAHRARRKLRRLLEEGLDG